MMSALSAPRQLLCPRRTLVPLAAAGLVALALTLTLVNFYDPARVPPWLARYFGNGLSAAMWGLFVTISLYALLQAWGLREEQRALVARARGQVRRLTPFEHWLRYLSGRQAAEEPALAWSLRRSAQPAVPHLAPPGDELLLIRAEQQRQILAPLVFASGVLPLLGFIGTVLGIAQALGGLQRTFTPGVPDAVQLSPVLAGLAFAFDTTFVGLTLVIPIMLYLAVLRARAQMVDLLYYQYLVITLAGAASSAQATDCSVQQT